MGGVYKLVKDNHIKFYILMEILKQYSDEENILSKKDIDRYMKENGYEPIKDNRTVHRYIEDMIKLGLDIEIIEKDNNYKGYYMVSHELEPYELRILSDCIYASKFITKKKSEEIINKLCKFNTIYNKYGIRRNAYIDDRSKTINEEIFYNVDNIDRAISEGKKISFNYYTYNEKKQLVAKLDNDNKIKVYTVNPVTMILQRDKYYLIGESNSRPGILTNYRIDRIKNVNILAEDIDDLKHIEECKTKFNPVEYTKRSFKMYSGKEMSEIILETNKRLLNVFIDELGDDVSIEKMGTDLYRVKFEAKISQGITKWILQLGHDVKVIYPQVLIENIKEEIQKINNLYNIGI